VANSFNISLFKTECLDDLTFEQFRVLIAFSERMRIEMSDAVGTEIDTGTQDPKKKERRTFRVVNED